jgi:hypothetical protein
VGAISIELAFRSALAMNLDEDKQGSVPAAADWISLAAAPTFAIMALLAGTFGGGHADLICSAAYGVSSLNGMVPMYVLMSAFHSAPWLKLISRRRKAAGVGNFPLNSKA